ncbi:hypothetical protein KGF57_002551 [Candida theae]|uniref:Matrin-type domain-containing protein n=1 Tax=Candida theae TaxID=1198502 RepID=A0AAD5BEK2_9ASCO|nr:uncharacterized protein KGF57_002551 [Candida theae]KAI5958196.1 hypothetical protein KGF57_002551 [Candida theae]
MPKYYCDYCKSYLTHDTMSVRKSHLMGKHHIKYYCDYYEFKAKETGEWSPQELIYEVTFDKLNKGIPGGGTSSSDKNSSNNYTSGLGAADRRSGDKGALDSNQNQIRHGYAVENADKDEEFVLPPPPHLTGLPPPPPAIYNNAREAQLAVHRFTQQ